MNSHAQNEISYDEADSTTYALYEKAAWKELLVYAKDAIAKGQDFPLLRLRLGYACVMLSNFSEALKQYDEVLKKDSYNAIALYYTWLCRNYLNQPELGAVSAKQLSAEVQRSENPLNGGV